MAGATTTTTDEPQSDAGSPEVTMVVTEDGVQAGARVSGPGAENLEPISFDATAEAGSQPVTTTKISAPSTELMDGSNVATTPRFPVIRTDWLQN